MMRACDVMCDGHALRLLVSTLGKAKEGLILVINASAHYEAVRGYLRGEAADTVLLDNESPAGRAKAYNARVCTIFVTARVLVADVLRGLLICGRVEQALVFHAECVESDMALNFCVTLLREAQINVLGLSDDLTKYGGLSSFDASVLVERIVMTAEMVRAEAAIRHLIEVCAEQLTCRGKLPRPIRYAASSQAFAFEAKAMLDSLEPAKARREARRAAKAGLLDLARLRCLARRLYVDDALTFLDRLVCLQRDAQDSAFSTSEAFDDLFVAAKERVFQSSKPWSATCPCERPPKEAAVRSAIERAEGVAVIMLLVRDEVSAAQVAGWLSNDPECETMGRIATWQAEQQLFGGHLDEFAPNSPPREGSIVPGCSRRIVIVTRDQFRRRVEPLSELRPRLIVVCDDYCETDLDLSGGCPVQRLRFHDQSLVAVDFRDAAALRDQRRRCLHHDKSVALKRPAPPLNRRRLYRRVVVDGRELRSALPPALHEAGFSLEIGVLPSGDYVPAAECGIERKAVDSGDLHASLESGRLFNQLRDLANNFELAVLLVEFTDGCYAPRFLNDSISAYSLPAKLAQIAMHYPTVRFCWSPSPSDTVALFEALSDLRGPPPTLDRCQAPCGARSSNSRRDDNDIAYYDDHSIQQRLLAKIPGCSRANIPSICCRLGSLRDLANLSLEQLKPILGGHKAALDCYTFFSRQVPCDATQ